MNHLALEGVHGGHGYRRRGPLRLGDGSLSGYRWGLQRKRQLLANERGEP